MTRHLLINLSQFRLYAERIAPRIERVRYGCGHVYAMRFARDTTPETLAEYRADASAVECEVCRKRGKANESHV